MTRGPSIPLPARTTVHCQHPGCPATYGHQAGRPDRPPAGWYVRWQGKLVVLCPAHAPPTLKEPP